jgi:hypothetical protein
LILIPNGANVVLASICHFFGLGPSTIKAMGPIYGSHPIGLLYFIGPPWTFDPHLKWPLTYETCHASIHEQGFFWGVSIASLKGAKGK